MLNDEDVGQIFASKTLPAASLTSWLVPDGPKPLLSPPAPSPDDDDDGVVTRGEVPVGVLIVGVAVVGMAVVGVAGVVVVPGLAVVALALAGYAHPAVLGSDVTTVAVPEKSQEPAVWPFF